MSVTYLPRNNGTQTQRQLPQEPAEPVKGAVPVKEPAPDDLVEIDLARPAPPFVFDPDVAQRRVAEKQAREFSNIDFSEFDPALQKDLEKQIAEKEGLVLEMEKEGDTQSARYVALSTWLKAAKAGGDVWRMYRGTNIVELERLVWAAEKGKPNAMLDAAKKLGIAEKDLGKLAKLAQESKPSLEVLKEAEALRGVGKHAEAASKFTEAQKLVPADCGKVAEQMGARATKCTEVAGKAEKAVQAAEGARAAGYTKLAAKIEKGAATSTRFSKVLSVGGKGLALVGKGLARITPGLNIAIACMDGAQFLADMKDPNATPTRKALSGITAGLSILAACPIPIPGVSVVCGLASLGVSFFRDMH